MKVYILKNGYDYEPSSIVGVFKNRTNALGYMWDELTDVHAEWKEVYKDTWRSEHSPNEYYEIEEYEVK